MAATDIKGINVRRTGTAVVFDAFLQSSAGALVVAGNTTLFLWRVESDGTVSTYDFNDNTFKTGACVTESAAMTHRKTNNGGTDTGYWSLALATLTGFTVGATYCFRVNNAAASPADQLRKFQYGGAEGDVLTTAGAAGVAYPQTDMIRHALVPAEVDTYGRLKVDVEDALGVPAQPTDPFAAPLGGYASNTLGGVLQTIGSGQVSVVTAVTASGDVTLTRGASYFAADGRALTFTDASGNAWPDLTGAAATWQAAAYRGGPAVLTTAATVVSPSGAGKTVRVEPSAADTAFLVAPNYVHELWATLANGHKVLLAAGAVTVAG